MTTSKTTARKPATPKTTAAKKPAAAKPVKAAAPKPTSKKGPISCTHQATDLQVSFVKTPNLVAAKPGEYDLTLLANGVGGPKALRATIVAKSKKRLTREEVARAIALIALEPAQALYGATFARSASTLTVGVSVSGVEDPSAQVLYTFKLSMDEIVKAGK